MVSLSASTKVLDLLLSSPTNRMAIARTNRFNDLYSAKLYIDQRKKLVEKPLRELTAVGVLAMEQLSNIGKLNYPDVSSSEYPAHFLGIVHIDEVTHTKSNTVIAFHWLDRYFEPLQEL